ncbi:Hybrid signal transduction histidine kinase J [Sesbania bispinosa]|nr:Hybrid signal transduction histidine kinase J [Sesbania bispinosa]
MGINCRHVFDRLRGFATSWKKRSTPSGRRIFHRDVEKEEFQYASTQCLSSYYSVFVVRLAIMVMLAILIGLLTFLTWHFTKIYTTKSLNSLAYDLRYELLQRPILRMWNILNSTAEITTAQVKLSEYVIRSHSNLATQAQQVEMYEAMRAVTWALFASRKALNSITVQYRNGFVQAFHRDLKDNNTFYIYSDLANYSIVASGYNEVNSFTTNEAWNDKDSHGNKSAIWYREPLDPVSGEKIGKAMKIAPEDSINIAGLSQVPDGVASWHVAVSKFTDSPLLSAALPVWDSSNKSIVAVVGVTTALYSVGQLMKELVELHSGHMYLTSQEGYLLATSTNDPLLTNSTKPPKLKMAVDSENEVIRQGAQWLKKTYGNNFPPSHEVHVENVRLGHQQYYIDSFFLNLKRLPLVGVIIIPRKHIMGQADERAFKTLVILISASLCIIVIGCVCILILTNGVSKEMKLRAELISHLEARRKAEASSNYKSQFLANMRLV